MFTFVEVLKWGSDLNQNLPDFILGKSSFLSIFLERCHTSSITDLHEDTNKFFVLNLLIAIDFIQVDALS